MVRKTDSAKSQGLQEIKKKFGENSFFSNRVSAEGKDNLPQIVVRDALQDLNKVMPFSSRKKPEPSPYLKNKRKLDKIDEIEEEGVTLRDIMNAVLRPFDKMPYNQAAIYVLGFDKFDFVCAAKTDEQEKRSKNLNVKNLKPIDFTDFSKPILHFSEYLQDRDGWRKKIIRFISLTLIKPGTNFTLRTQSGKVFIIDGHCLSLKDLKDLSKSSTSNRNFEVEIVELDKMKTDSNVYMCPISIHIAKNDERKIAMELELINNIGECDFLPFFYMNYMNRGFEKNLKFKNFEIISFDTDTVYLSLIYFYNILMSLQSIDPSTNKKPALPQIIIQKIIKGKSEWININNLYQNIIDMDCNVIDLIIVLTSCGSDFTFGHYGVNFKRFFDAYDEFKEHIGPLFKYTYDELNYKDKINVPKSKDKRQILLTYHNDKDRLHYLKKDYFPKAWILPNDFLISASAYMRLLKCAYGKAYPNRINSSEIEGMSIFNTGQYLTGELGPIKKTLSKNKLMPPVQDLKDSLYQVYYCMRMMFSVGLPTVKDTRPLNYGYKLRDPTKGIEKGNLTKKIFID